ncbi:hypothetical protein IFE09_23220 [Streptomyces microflavus]|uniref:hypothetical protein n=1 Tax=Streptomyces microflavus TaxID=1919 RepID=UPI00192AA542|nr:hypothetical protein [Streptomyces microflavus]QQZ56189.1 hypothetical protein IFE09_23220 [Streptomyces microflavus]
MSIRRTTTTRRFALAVAVTAAFALGLTGCGDDGGAEPRSESTPEPSAPASSPTAEDKGEQQVDTVAGENVDPNARLAEARGLDGLTLVINQVKRDSGGFVTVQGVIKNEGAQSANTTAWAGSESALLAANPNSVAGATLVDKVGKKRYYILRDTESRCLCTTGIPPLLAGKTTSVFMQFPAPPAGSTEVDFTLPTFATTSLKISG